MSGKRRDLIRYLEKNSFYLLKEGGKSFHLHKRQKGNSGKKAQTTRSNHG